MPDPRIQRLISLYQVDPFLFQPDELELLERNLSSGEYSLNIPVAPEEQDLWDTSVGAATKLFNGFITGFTTIPVGDEPRNVTEAIAQNVGHLLGFVGYVPGLGSAAKGTAMGIGTILGKSFKAGTVAAARAGKVAQGIQKVAGSNASVPMFVANSIMKGLEKSASLHKAGSAAGKFLSKHGLPETFLKHMNVFDESSIGYGALHLGLASAASAAPPWEARVNERLDALMHGAIAGGAFRAFGTWLPNAPRNINNQGLFKNIMLSSKDPKGAMRMVSSALFMGLPATAEDAPLEMQVYQYLTGIVFGAGELSRPQREWLKFYHTTAREKYGALSKNENEIIMRNAEKAFPEAWEKLDPAAKKIHREQMDLLGYRRLTQASNFVARAEKNAIENSRAKYKEQLDNGEISPQDYENKVRKLDEAQLHADYIKELESRVESAVLKDLADPNIKESRRDLEYKHSARVMKDILDRESDTFIEMAEVVREVNRTTYGENDKESIKVKEEFDKWRQIAVDYALTEKESLPYNIVHPASDLVLRSLKETDVTPEILNKRTMEIMDRLDEAVKAKKSFADVAKEFEQEYGVDLTSPQPGKENPVYQSLAKSFTLAKMNKIYDGYIDAANGKVMSMEEFGGRYVDDTPGYTYKADTFLKTVLERAGYKDFQILTVKRAITWEGERTISELGHADRLEQVIRTAEEAGYSVLGGRKDSPVLTLVRHLFKEDAEWEGVIKRFIGAPTETDVRLLTAPGERPQFRYEERASAIRRLAANKGILDYIDNPVRGRQEWTRFLKNLANNILVLEALNGGDVNTWYQQPGFFKGAKDYNKRISLIMNGFSPLEKEFFESPSLTDRKTIVPGKLRTLFLSAINSDGGPQVPNKEFTVKFYNEAGELQERATSAHLDGGVLVRGKTFDSMSRQIGSEMNISSHKGSLTHLDSDGMLLGKYLYQRATPELDKWMETNSIDMIIPQDAVKHAGRRNFTDWIWMDGELIPRDINSVYDIPLESFSLIFAGEHKEQMGKIYKDGVAVSGTDHRIAIQFASGLDGRFPSTREHIKSLIERAVVGDRTENQKAYDYLYNNRKEFEDIDVDALGAEAKIALLFSGKDSPLFRKVSELVMKKSEEDMMAENLSMVIDYQKFLTESRDAAPSTAQRIIDLADITPAVLHSAPVRQRFMRALQNHLINSIMRPKAEGSWVGKFHIAFGEILEKHPDFEQGQVLVTRDVAKNKIVETGSGERITVEEALKRYNEDPSEENAKTLEILGQRVPTSSMSGIRVLRIAGIVDIPGTAAWLHPKDLWYKDGADMDGDSAFFYPLMPRKVVEEFRKVQTEWEDVNGVTVDFKGQDNPFRELTYPRQEAMIENPLSIFDGETMAEVGRRAFTGNEELGFGINVAKRVNAMLNFPKEMLGVLKPKGNKREFDYAKAQFIQMTADAANGEHIVDFGKAEKILMESAFTKESVDKFFKAMAVRNSKEPAVKLYKNLKKLDAIVKGRDYDGRQMGFDKIMDELFKVDQFMGYSSTAENKVTGEKWQRYHDVIWNPFYFGAMTISRLDPTKMERPIDWINAEFADYARDLEIRLRKDKRLLKMLGRREVKFHNRPVKTEEEQKKAPTVERAGMLSELLSQDVGEVAYFPFLEKYSKGFDLEHAMSINNAAAKLKHLLNLYKSVRNSDNEALRQQAIEQGVNLDQPIGAFYRDIDNQIRLWKANRSQKEQDLFDVFMLNPLAAQPLTKAQYISSEMKRIKAKERPEASIKELESEWYTSSIKSVPWNLQSINNSIVKDYWNFYNMIGQRAQSKSVDAGTLRLVDQMVEDKVVDLGMELDKTADEFIVSNWIPRREKLVKAIQKFEPETDVEKALIRAEGQIQKFLERYPAYIPEFHAFAEGILIDRNGRLSTMGSSLELATPDQVIYLGNMLEAIMSNRGKPRKIKGTDYIFRTLATIGRQLIKYDPKTFKTKAPVLFQDSQGRFIVKDKDVIRLTSTAGEIAQLWTKADIAIDGLNTEDKERYVDSDLYKLHVTLDEQHQGLGSKLFTLAMVRKEAAVRIPPPAEGGTPVENEYIKRYNSVRSEIEKAELATEQYYVPHLREKKTQGEIMNMFHDWMTQTFTDAQSKLFNPAYERWFINRYDGSREAGNLFSANGYPIIQNWAKALEHYNNRGSGKMLGMHMVEFLKKWWLIDKFSRVNPLWIINDTIKNRRNWQVLGLNREHLSQVLNREEPGFRDMNEVISSPLLEQLRRRYTNLPQSYERMMLERFLALEDNALRNHEGFLLRNENSATKDHFYTRFGYDPGGPNPRRLGENWTDTYFPHMEFNKREVEEWIKGVVRNAVEEGENPAVITERARDAQLSIRETAEERAMLSYLDVLQNPEPLSDAQMREVMLRLGSAESRSHAPTPGWALHKDIPLRYMEKLNSVYYKFMANFTSEFAMDRLAKSNALGDQTQNWVKFLSIYNRNQMGLSSTYPDSWLKNRELKIKPLYYPFIDQAYEKFLDKIAGKWFKKHPLSVVGRTLTEEQFNAMTPQEQHRIREMVKADYGRLINRISNLEAKWNFLSLLTHTKTFVANLTGGSLLTVINTGIHPYLKAGNLDYMRRHHFLEMKSKEEIQAFAEKHGAIEGLFKVELGLQHAWKTGKFKDFGKEVFNYLRRYNYNEDAIKTLAGKSGISDSLFNSAAWFMRKSEVMLRSRSFLAHLIKHKETLNMFGYDVPNDHPWLVELANRGVQATQFLYNNANRPMFAQTALGKIYSRFQLWAWNSIKFRRDLIQEANEYGWEPGSQEFERLKRMMAADMFMLALASTFPSSLFENTLAPPFSYLQDLSDFFFGDEEERDRAFYGVLPFPANIMQPLSPPSTRVLYETIKLMSTGDWEKFLERGTTWVPFGRFGQSTYRALQNPAMVVENFTSLPVHRLNALMKKKKVRIAPTPGIGLSNNNDEE